MPTSSLSAFHKNFGGGGLQQACHVFQAEDMCARGFELFGHVDVIFQVIFGAGGVENIACVADRAFAELCRCLARRPSPRACFRPS